jgi:hypothetical protein
MFCLPFHLMILGSNSHPTIGLFWSNGWRFLLSLTHSIIELCLCVIAWCIYIFLIWYSCIYFPTRSMEDFPIFTIYSFILQYWCLLLRKNINTQEYGGQGGVSYVWISLMFRCLPYFTKFATWTLYQCESMNLWPFFRFFFEVFISLEFLSVCGF